MGMGGSRGATSRLPARPRVEGVSDEFDPSVSGRWM